MQCSGKNGVTGIYLFLLNLSEENRSNRNSYMTVQLFKNSQLKNFSFNEIYQRLVTDINKLQENGFVLPNGSRTSVRLVTYKMDNLEKHQVSGLKKNFSRAKNFSSHSYMTSDNRISARTIQDILPENFEQRTPESHRVGCKAKHC